MEREQAIRILTAQKVVSEPGIYKNIKVTNVSFANANGEPWTWEGTGDRYAIVNFQMTNLHGRSEAVKDMKNEDYVKALNHNMSMRADIELAKEIKAVGIANVEVAERTLKSGEKALLPVRAAAGEMREAATMSMDSLLKELNGDIEEPEGSTEEVVDTNSVVTEEEPSV